MDGSIRRDKGRIEKIIEKIIKRDEDFNDLNIKIIYYRTLNIV